MLRRLTFSSVTSGTNSSKSLFSLGGAFRPLYTSKSTSPELKSLKNVIIGAKYEFLFNRKMIAGNTRARKAVVWMRKGVEKLIPSPARVKKNDERTMQNFSGCSSRNNFRPIKI